MGTKVHVPSGHGALILGPDEDFPYAGFNEPFLSNVDGKPHLFMLAEDTELGHDVEVLIIEITDEVTEKKARAIAKLLQAAGNKQAEINEQEGG